MCRPGLGQLLGVRPALWFGPFEADVAGLRSNEPGKVLALPNGGEEDVSRYVSAWRQIRLPDREPAPLAAPVRAMVKFAKA